MTVNKVANDPFLTQFLRKTCLDDMDNEKTGRRSYKVIGDVVPFKENQSLLRCEYTYPKLEKFCNWIRHQFFNEFTDRDLLKHESTVDITNHIREDLNIMYPNLSAKELNQVTDIVVDKATHGKIRVGHDPINGEVTPKDEKVPVCYNNARPHAFSSKEITRANELLHHANVFGIKSIRDIAV